MSDFGDQPMTWHLVTDQLLSGYKRFQIIDYNLKSKSSKHAAIKTFGKEECQEII